MPFDIGVCPGSAEATASRSEILRSSEGIFCPGDSVAREIQENIVASSERVREGPASISEVSAAIALPRKASDGLSEPPNFFVCEGEYWRIAFHDRLVRLKDSKGIQYLACLLARPGDEVHVADLVSMVVAEFCPREYFVGRSHTGAQRRASLGNAGPTIDRRARAEYRVRLHELRRELDEASAWGDLGRADRIRKETEFLTKELTSAFGVGGRPRKDADVTERMRKAVANRIRDALTRITKYAPPLGDHLKRRIRTGTFCSYVPTSSVTWELR